MNLVNALLHKMLMMPVRVMEQQIWFAALLVYVLMVYIVLRIFQYNRDGE